jgi:hypothetical protein
MAAPYTQADIVQGFGAETAINAETTKIETAFGTCLNKDNSTDNTMNVDLDMGGNDILNVGSITVNLTVVAGITASTTQTQGQGALTGTVNQVSTVANTNDTVTLPTAAAGVTVIIKNSGANTLRIYPASGDNLGAGVDTATTLAAGAAVQFITYDDTNWFSV